MTNCSDSLKDHNWVAREAQEPFQFHSKVRLSLVIRQHEIYSREKRVLKLDFFFCRSVAEKNFSSHFLSCCFLWPKRARLMWEKSRRDFDESRTDRGKISGECVKIRGEAIRRHEIFSSTVGRFFLNSIWLSSTNRGDRRLWANVTVENKKIAEFVNSSLHAPHQTGHLSAVSTAMISVMFEL